MPIELLLLLAEGMNGLDTHAIDRRIETGMRAITGRAILETQTNNLYLATIARERGVKPNWRERM